MQDEAEVKRVQLLKEVLPGVVRIAVLRNPDRPRSEVQLQVVKRAANAVGLEVTTWGRIQCR